MKIVHAELVPFAPKFADGKTYVMSIYAQSVLDNGLLTITTDTGLCGTGEVARFASFEKSAYDQAEAWALALLADVDVAAIPALVSNWQAQNMHLRGISFALDCAWHDIVSQMTGLPMSVLLGGPPSGDVPEILSLSAGSIDETLTTVRADARVAPVIQLKLGVDDLPTDMACVRAVLQLLGDEQLVLADFNGALTPQAAMATLPALTDERLYWEDPCRTYDDNVTVARAVPTPVMVDSSLTDLPLVARAIADGVGAVCIKPAKLGGMGISRVARDMCIAAGIKLRIDGPWSGQLCAHAALALGIGAPAGQFLGSIDLSQPIDTAHDLISRPAPGRVGPAR